MDPGPVLVIEDGESTANTLRSAGFRVEHAPTTLDARLALGRLRPTIILLDVMVDSKAWNFLVWKGRDPQVAPVPLVIITGLTAASPEWAKAQGAVSLLRKPFDAQAVLTEVRRHT
jgi:DNA-binding response OmpR family regulator